MKKGYASRTGNRGFALTVPAAFVLAELEEAKSRIEERGLRSIAPATLEGLKATVRDLDRALCS